MATDFALRRVRPRVRNRHRRQAVSGQGCFSRKSSDLDAKWITERAEGDGWERFKIGGIPGGTGWECKECVRIRKTESLVPQEANL